ncbi:hypothetical protein DV736_g5026, partial [Chaetothyriales sp. CBS 134916]
MALAAVVPLAATIAAAAYLDAKFLIRYDISSGSAAANASATLAFVQQKYAEDKMLVYHIFEDRARTPQGDDLFLEFEGRRWTYRQFFDELQPVGNWLLKDLGVQAGEIVALDGGNSPEYIKIWFALEALGAVPAFINCNLTSKALIHSIRLGGARYLLADSDVKGVVEGVETELAEAGTKVLYWDQAFVARLTDTTPLPKERRSKIDPNALSSLIYTSGTTGLPKGTIISRARFLAMTRLTTQYLGLRPGTKIYTCLPLYHGAAQGLCVVPSIAGGSAVALGRKFSHKTFWPEVRESNADILQYVGELCRYLVNAPPSPLDKQHNVRMAWGNGMRPDVWETFRERFGIECINELYAATDGVSTLFNANRGPFTRNAIAVRGPLWRLRNGNNEKMVRIDPDSQEIVRDENGFAIACKLGEAGEVVHRLDPAAPSASFKGYYGNKAASDKRMIADLFAPGDLWFRSGDMMRHDSNGLVQFVDRLGDTFRWHSENVSTNEVADVLGNFPQIAEANVYGVLVPHSDGRAGCAALVPTSDITWDKFDFKALAEHALDALPRYAAPIFVRLARELEYTGTMKMQKARLRAEGIDLDKIAEGAREKNEEPDQIYWLPPAKREYVPFEQRDWLEIKGGKVRL